MLGSVSVAMVLCAMGVSVQEIGADKVGIRLSPYGTFNDATDSDPHSLYTYLCSQLRDRGIAYVHMIESRVNGAVDVDPSSPQVRNVPHPGHHLCEKHLCTNLLPSAGLCCMHAGCAGVPSSIPEGRSAAAVHCGRWLRA